MLIKMALFTYERLFRYRPCSQTYYYTAGVKTYDYWRYMRIHMLDTPAAKYARRMLTQQVIIISARCSVKHIDISPLLICDAHLLNHHRHSILNIRGASRRNHPRLIDGMYLGAEAVSRYISGGDISKWRGMSFSALLTSKRAHEPRISILHHYLFGANLSRK